MRYLALVICLLFCLQLQSQSCGSELITPPNWMYSDLESYRGVNRSGVLDSIGVAVHILADGLNPVTREEVQAELDEVNLHFENAGMYFFICAFGEVFGQTTYTAKEVEDINQELHVPRRINLYIPRIFTKVGNIQICGQSRFPWDDGVDNRYLVVSRKCLDNGSTMTHEFGHFFGLLHTHETAMGIEYVNRTNCHDAGDMLCDTPADPLIDHEDMNGCNYLGLLRDPVGDLYAPDPSLIMSYAPKACRNQFTPDQYALIRYYGNELRPEYTSNCDNLPDISLQAEMRHDTLSFHEPITLELNITHSIVSDTSFDLTLLISNNRYAFSQILRSEFIETKGAHGEITRHIQISLPPDLPGGRHYLKIYADAEQLFQESNELNNFDVLAFQLEHEQWNNATLFPNPASHTLHFFYSTDLLPGPYTLSVYDVSGRQIRDLKGTGQTLDVYANIDVSDLASGMYVLRFSSDHIAPESWPFIVASGR